MLNHFGTQSGSFFTSPGNRAEPVEIWKAKNLIHQDPAGELSLTRVADAVNVSPNHLSEKFKQVTGVNFVVYVSLLRFERARLLLHDSKLRISEIAFAVGFQSLSQFNRIFKKLSSQSPTEYRAQRVQRGKVPRVLKSRSAPKHRRKNA